MTFIEKCSRSRCSCRRKRYMSLRCAFQYPRMPSNTPVPYLTPGESTWILASAKGTILPFIEMYLGLAISLPSRSWAMGSLHAGRGDAAGDEALQEGEDQG